MGILDYIERIKRENEGPRITARDGGSMPEHLTKMEPKIDDAFWINHYSQVIDARLGAMEEVRKRGEPQNPDDAKYLFEQYNELKKYGGDTLEFDQRIKKWLMSGQRKIYLDQEELAPLKSTNMFSLYRITLSLLRN